MNQFLQNSEDGELLITEEGHLRLADIVSNTRENVYAIMPGAPLVSVSAAMARLSRSSNGFRVVYLNEFLDHDEKALKLHETVINEYGDDSVQQLMPVLVVVELASNLLTKKLEWGRFGSYLEQSTRYMFFDKKVNGQYRYHVPGSIRENGGEDLHRFYVSTMDRIFMLYSRLAVDMTDYIRRTSPAEEGKADAAWRNATRVKACDIIRCMLPVATQSTVGIVGSSQAIDNMIMNLAAEDLPECVQASKDLLREVRKVARVFFSRTDMPNRGGAIVQHKKDVRKQVSEFVNGMALMTKPYMLDDSTVTLLDYYPRDEFSVIADILYPRSNASYYELVDAISGMSPVEKQEIIRMYIGNRTNRRQKPGRAFENLFYKWQITGDYGTFRDLQRHRVVDGFQWQNLRPDLGFTIPAEVKATGLSMMMEEAIDLSSTLYDKLMTAGLTEEAQYATLLGHRMRYTFSINARASFHLHELRTGPQGHAGYRKIVNQMHDEVCLVHPNIAAGMVFVNRKDDDPLNRLESERRTQSKLATRGIVHQELT